MFDKLYSAFAKAAKSLGEKELNEKDIDNVLFDLEMSLLEADVASEVIDEIKLDIKRDLIGTKVEKSIVQDTIQNTLKTSILSLFDATGKIDIMGMINEKKERGEPFLILFVGINGTGKTTSLAKFAYMLQQAKYSVVVAASDTFRAGAIEQLKEHTKRLNIKIVAQNYNSDPAAVARDAVLYAKAHKTDCVLIDTAGRMQTSKNLMEQIAKITKVVNPDIKIFVGDALAGNDTVNQAREFYEHTKFNASILTKADADARGGAALSIVKVTSAPIIYVGVGQEYQDLKPFDKNVFLNIVFGDADKSTHSAQVTKEEIVSEIPVKEEIIKQTNLKTQELDSDTKLAREQLQVLNTESAEDLIKVKPNKISKTTQSSIESESEPLQSIAQSFPPSTTSTTQSPTASTPPEPEPQQLQSPTASTPPEPEPQQLQSPTSSTPPEPEPQQLQSPTSSTPPEPEPQQLQSPTSSTPPEPEPQQLQHTSQPQPSAESKESHSTNDEPQSYDPFYGISDEDITRYSEIFNVEPPENDKDAHKMANKIREWLKDRSDENTKYTSTQDYNKQDKGEIKTTQNETHDSNSKGNIHEIDNKDKKETPKKRRGMFGFFKR